jgi:hypothetical protein
MSPDMLAGRASIGSGAPWALRWFAAVSLALAVGTATSHGNARPGGGSSFGGGRSSSSSGGGSRSSGGGSRSSGGSSTTSGGNRSSSSGGSSRSSGGGTSSTPRIPIVSYQARAGSDRQASLWVPGTPGSAYGAGPTRPAELNVESESTNAIATTLLLLLAFGVIAIPMVLVGVVIAVARRKRGSGWTTAERGSEGPSAVAPQRSSVRRQLEALRRADPEFSIVLLEDFLYALYAEAHTARGAGTLSRLSPWVGPQAREALDRLGRTPVSAIIVGAMRFVEMTPIAGAWEGFGLTVEFEACYSEGFAGAARYWYAQERWHLVRSVRAKSRPPDRIRVFACPNCGAPLDRIVGSLCKYCNQVVDGGAFDWTVDKVQVTERTERGPILTGATEETGTNLATVWDPAVAQSMTALLQRDPAFSDQGFQARVALIFHTLQAAWSSLQWERARPILSDRLWESQSYWIAAYRASGLHNVTENTQINRVEIVRLTSDRWFDAMTVRLYATGLDYTVRTADNTLVGGDRTKPRAYSEYWTLIRATGKTGPSRADAACPNCGAPLQVNMAAQCGSCGAKVNSGVFDWVLSRIEQDECYEG